MRDPSWCVFDLGNTLVKLAYPRVLAAIAADSTASAHEIEGVLEEPGFYRDLERGECSFDQFHAALAKRIGYRGSLQRLRSVWSDFFDGPVEGMEALISRLRKRYRVGFLSNSNEVHAAVLPTQFPTLFHAGDPFVFSHACRSAKPDREIFEEASRAFGVPLTEMIYVDDLSVNVEAARNLGMIAFEFIGAERLAREMAQQGLL